MGKLTELMDLVTEKERVIPERTQKLMDDLEAMYKKALPNSWVQVSTRNIMSRPYLQVSVGMIEDINDVSSRIRENDPALQSYIIQPLNPDFSLSDNMEVTKVRGGVYTYPPEGSFLAMKSQKVPFRKFKGDETKIRKGFERELDKFLKVLRAHKDNIYGSKNNGIDKKYFKGI